MTVATFLKNHFSLLLVLALIIIILIVSWSYIAVVIFAASLAVVGIPLYRKLHRKLPAPFSSFIVTTLISAIIAAIFMVIVLVLVSDSGTLSEMINSIVAFIGHLFGFPIGVDAGGSIVSTILNVLAPALPEFVVSAASVGVYVCIGCILFYALLYLFLIFGEKICADLWSIIPEQSRPNVGLMAGRTKDILFSLYIVNFIMALITFGLAVPFFLLLGYGHVIFYSVLCGLFALIPVLGPLMIIIFVALYALSIGDWFGLILTMTMGYFLTCILTDFFLRPKLTARRVKIRPMLMFIGFFGGAAVMGLLGFVLGPVLLVLGIAAYEIFFKEMRQVKKEIDTAGDAHPAASANPPVSVNKQVSEKSNPAETAPSDTVK
ncbi:MAG: AI-2E family transporter [Methanocorpusculum sp.]|nr:AI-2E family transporter [Methanocorpusculum sp.]